MVDATQDEPPGSQKKRIAQKAATELFRPSFQFVGEVVFYVLNYARKTVEQERTLVGG